MRKSTAVLLILCLAWIITSTVLAAELQDNELPYPESWGQIRDVKYLERGMVAILWDHQLLIINIITEEVCLFVRPASEAELQDLVNSMDEVFLDADETSTVE